MFAVELLTSGGWIEYAKGAAGGALIAIGVHLFRDWECIVYRFKRRRRIARGDSSAHLEPEEYQGYLPFPLTQEDRRKLPITIAVCAAFGALLWGSMQPIAGFDPEIFMAVLAVLPIVLALARDQSGEVDAESPERKEGPSMGKRLLLVVGALGTFAFALIPFASNWIESELSIPPRNFLHGLLLLGSFGMMFHLVVRYRNGPPDGIDAFELEDWQKESQITAIATTVMLAITFLSLLL